MATDRPPPTMPATPGRRPRRTRSPRAAGTTPAGYAQIWALFTDWCRATDHQALPAEAGTVLAFLGACPAAVGTQRRRVVAVDHHHTAAGHPAPGDDDGVRAALGRPPRETVWVCPDRAAVDTALRALPSHGFTRGLFGQRDRALLVLAQVAGLPYRAVADLTATDLAHDAATGAVTITARGRRWVVTAEGDAVTCPACALTRWLATHAVMTRYIATKPLADHLNRVEPVTATRAHACREPLTGPVPAGPLLPPINQWGQVPFPQTWLSPHAVSRQTRDLLGGTVADHRHLVALAEPAGPPPTPVSAPEERVTVPPAVPWAGRRADQEQLAGIGDTLDEVERRAAELDRRVSELLAGTL